MADCSLMFNKIVFCGNYVELKEYKRPFRVGQRNYSIEIDRSKVGTIQERREDNLSRTRSKIHQIISCNISKYPKFLTLTCAKSVLDYNEFLYLMKQFFKNMKRKGYDLKYLWVVEHQTKRGIKEGNEGSYHAHIIIFNDEFIPFEVINSCWNGNTDIHILNGMRYLDNKETDEKIKNVASYVVKYITKDNLTEFGRNLYHCSRGLNRPENIYEYYDGYLDDKGKLIHCERSKIISNQAFDYFNNEKIIYDVKSYMKILKSDNIICCQVSKGRIDSLG